MSLPSCRFEGSDEMKWKLPVRSVIDKTGVGEAEICSDHHPAARSKQRRYGGTQGQVV